MYNSRGRNLIYINNNNRNLSKKSIDYVTEYNKTIEFTQKVLKYFDLNPSVSMTDINQNITESFKNDLNDCINGLIKMLDNDYFKFMYKNNLVK
jgi:hypothetical protein